MLQKDARSRSKPLDCGDMECELCISGHPLGHIYSFAAAAIRCNLMVFRSDQVILGLT